MAAVACNDSPSVNPFLSSWDTPYGIPDFGKVKEEHYIPAVKEGIAQQQAQIDAIIANTETPTFANVVEAYEASGSILDRVVGVLFNLSETDSTPAIQEIIEQVLPMLSEHSDNIFMNPAFFAKVDALYGQMESLGLTQEQKMVLEKLHRAFVQNGVALDEASQERMRKINMELSSLSNTFGNRLLAENNAFAASCAFAASSSPCTSFVNSNARISFALFNWLPSQSLIASISSNGRNVSIRIHFITSASATFLQYW